MNKVILINTVAFALMSSIGAHADFTKSLRLGSNQNYGTSISYHVLNQQSQDGKEVMSYASPLYFVVTSSNANMLPTDQVQISLTLNRHSHALCGGNDFDISYNYQVTPYFDNAGQRFISELKQNGEFQSNGSWVPMTQSDIPGLTIAATSPCSQDSYTEKLEISVNGSNLTDPISGTGTYSIDLTANESP